MLLITIINCHIFVVPTPCITPISAGTDIPSETQVPESSSPESGPETIHLVYNTPLIETRCMNANQTMNHGAVIYFWRYSILYATIPFPLHVENIRQTNLHQTDYHNWPIKETFVAHFGDLIGDFGQSSNGDRRIKCVVTTSSVFRVGDDGCSRNCSWLNSSWVSKYMILRLCKAEKKQIQGWTQ